MPDYYLKKVEGHEQSAVLKREAEQLKIYLGKQGFASATEVIYILQ